MDSQIAALRAELQQEIRREVAAQRVRAQIDALRRLAWFLIACVYLVTVVGVAVALATAA